jgi:AraC family transcriptional regulator
LKQVNLVEESHSLDIKSDKHSEAIRTLCLFIEENLDQDISLERLSKMVFISPYHLHRIFSRIKGEPLKSYVRRLRLERSAYELKISKKPLLDVALESGYVTHETFTRAFRQRFGVNPSDFQRRYHLYSYSDNGIEIPKRINISNVGCSMLDSMWLAYIRVTGPYATSSSPQTTNSPWQILLKAMQLRRVRLESPRYVGVCHDDPQITSDEDIRFDAGVIVSKEYKGDSLIRVRELKAGPYIVARHVGTVQQLTESYEYLLNEWIANTPYQLRNEPLFEVYHNTDPNDDGGIDVRIPIVMR